RDGNCQDCGRKSEPGPGDNLSSDLKAGQPECSSGASSLPAFQIIQQLLRTLVSRFGIALQTFAYYIAEHAGNGSFEVGDGDSAFLGTLQQTGERAIRFVRDFAAEQFVEDEADGEDIRTLVEF